MPTVKLFANLRKIAGAKELTAAGTSLREVLADLEKLNPALGSTLLENGQLRPHVIVTLNGHPVTDLNVGFGRQVVTEQDQIAIFPPIAGG